MHRASDQRVQGFHGTSLSNATSILANGFRISRNSWDWLGDGVYFFQDGPQLAWEWAKIHHSTEPVVIATTIHLERCMDLLDLGWKEVLMQAYDDFQNELKRQGLPLPRQTPGAHRLDRFVINYAIERMMARGHAQIGAVRGVFTEGKPLFPNSFLLDHSHIQIAVRDLSLIEDVHLAEMTRYGA